MWFNAAPILHGLFSPKYFNRYPIARPWRWRVGCLLRVRTVISLRWRHNERDGVSNHQHVIVYSTIYSGAEQREHQSYASLAYVPGIHRWPVNSPHKRPVTRKMFPFDDVIMYSLYPLQCRMQYYVISDRPIKSSSSLSSSSLSSSSSFYCHYHCYMFHYHHYYCRYIHHHYHK